MVTSFYDCTNYEPLCQHSYSIVKRSSKINFSDRYPNARAEILASFDEPSIANVGILHREYMLFGGYVLAERTGGLIANCSADIVEAYFSQPGIAAAIDETRRDWDEVGLVPNSGRVPNLAVLAHPYANNYYHFSLEMIPRRRHFTGVQEIIPLEITKRPFQRDLLSRSMGSMGCRLPPSAVRVRDPLLACDTVSEEGIQWLRKASRISARAGERRIYARRAARGTRSMGSGGLSESLSLKALLHEFQFETVDFGNGEHGVAAQIAMLDGAGVILSPHGAGLTNLAYLNPPLIVIEVVSPIVVDPDELRDVFHHYIGYQS